MGSGVATILVVDDNDDLRDLAVVIVEDLGYRVLAARDGAEALQLIEGGEAVDLLFTDIAMTGEPDGFELARRAKAMRPALKVIYTTGFSSRLPDERPQALGPILYKPYRPVRLAAEIKRLLEGG
jgi:CheY-like chemotaxis protein